jgi:hypothetical protein
MAMGTDGLKKHLGKVRLAVIAFGVIGCIVVIAYNYHEHGLSWEILVKLIEDVAPALVVTYLLLYLYDDMEQRLFARLLFRTVLGDHVTPEVIDVFRREIGDNALIRPTSSWHYEFTVADGKLRLRQTISSTLMNLALKPRTHVTPRLGASSDAEVKLESYTFDSGGEAQEPIVYFYEVSPPPQTIAIEPSHGNHCTEELVTIGTYPLESAFDQNHTKTYIGVLTIDVAYPSDYRFELVPHFSCTPRVNGSLHSKPGDPIQRRKWEVATVLPQQGISFRLTRQGASGAAAHPAYT